jgi:hypothetical protein
MVKEMDDEVERWGVFEISLRGPEGDNPFIDLDLSAKLEYENRMIEADGFYDGDRVYMALRIRKRM